MNLYIGSKTREPDSLCLTHKAVRDKDAILFAAMYEWDTLFVELFEELPLYSLKYVREKAKSVKVHFSECTQHILKLLIELFPDREGVLRKGYNEGNLDEVLCGVWWDRTDH
jgi:hypothetical protein